MRICRLAARAAGLAGLLLTVSCNSGPIAPAAPPRTSPPGPAPVPPSVRVTLYTLTVSSSETSGPCEGVPSAVRRRVYMADVEQTGSVLEVSLSGAEFVSNTFRGVVDANGDITFTIRPASPWDEGFDVLERLSDGSLLIVSGVIKARSTAAVISGSGGEIRPAHTDSRWCQIDSFEMVPRAAPWDY
jgi:hypothetical protein